jgi:hypothetical protein
VVKTRITLQAVFRESGTSPAARGKLKEVDGMRISRKMQRQVEIKIRHAMATGQLPVVERNSTTGNYPRPELDRADGNDAGHSK